MSGKTFSKMPHWLLAKVAAGELAPGVLVTFAALAKHANRRGKGVWPSNRTLMAETGFSERTVQNHKRDLEAVGATETVPRHAASGRQTSNLVILHFEEPDEPEIAPPGSPLPPPAERSEVHPPPRSPLPPYEPDQERTTLPDPVVKEEVNSLDDPSDSPIPNFGTGSPLPVVRRRQLMNAGVTNESGPAWEQAWATVTSMQWPDGMEMEAANYPDEHLAQHVMQALERGYPLSPSRWVQFYIADRQRQIEFARQRMEQTARLAEDPAEREARQNRHLPPDRSQEYAPTTTTTTGAQQ